MPVGRLVSDGLFVITDKVSCLHTLPSGLSDE
jgi:hypothetical protein